MRRKEKNINYSRVNGNCTIYTRVNCVQHGGLTHKLTQKTCVSNLTRKSTCSLNRMQDACISPMESSSLNFKGNPIMFLTFKMALQILERIFLQLRSEKLQSTSYTVVSSVLCVYCLSRCPVLYNFQLAYL